MSQATRASLPFELATEATFHHGYALAGRADEAHREVLTFELAGEEYACDVLRIREILKPRPVTEVPRAPAFVPGIVTVRGQVVPLLDLRLRLHLPLAGPTKDTRVLIVTRQEEPFGLIVDRVRQVVRLREEEVEPTPSGLSAQESEFVQGIGRPEGRLVILLALDAVLAFAAGPRSAG